MAKNPTVHTDEFYAVIKMPKGKPKVQGSYRSHYLWIGHSDDCIGTVSKKRELKKLRKMIDMILGEGSE